MSNLPVLKLAEMGSQNMNTIGIKLFLVGQGGFSAEARNNLDSLAKAFPQYHFEIEVVDVLEQPERAAEDRVVATPTVIKYSPLPACRIVGDLSDSERVIRALGLPAGMPLDADHDE